MPSNHEIGTPEPMATPESLGDLDNFSPQNGKELAGIVTTFPDAFEKLASSIYKIFDIDGVQMPESVTSALDQLIVDSIRSNLLAACSAAKEAEQDYYQRHEFFLKTSE